MQVVKHLVHPHVGRPIRRAVCSEAVRIRRRPRQVATRSLIMPPKDVHVCHQFQPLDLRERREVPPVSVPTVHQGIARRHELAHRVGIKPQHRLVLLGEIWRKRALGLFAIDPGLGCGVLAVIIVEGDGPRRRVADHVHDRVARWHWTRAQDDFRSRPHFDALGGGTVQGRVESRTPPNTPPPGIVDTQNTACSIRKEDAEVMAGLVVVNEGSVTLWISVVRWREVRRSVVRRRHKV